MGCFSWLVDSPLMKAGWRSASMECGEQCVTLAGVAMMPELCADNWGTVSAQVGLSWEQDNHYYCMFVALMVTCMQLTGSC